MGKLDSVNSVRQTIRPIPAWSIFASVALWVLLCLAVMATTVIDQLNEHRVRFNQMADEYAEALNVELLGTSAVLKAFSSLFVTAGYASPDRVKTYVHDVIKDHPAIFALEIVERVEKNELPSFIERQKTVHPAFRLKSFDYSARGWKPVTDQSVYYPIIFAEPRPPVLDELIGMDIGSVPFLASSVESTYRFKTVAWTAPFKLVQGNTGLLIFSPIAHHPQLMVDMVINVDKLSRPLRLMASEDSGFTVQVSHLAWRDHASGGKLIELASGEATVVEQWLFPEFRYSNTLKSFDFIHVHLEHQVGWHDLDLDILTLMLMMTALTSWGLFNYMKSLHLSRLVMVENANLLWKMANHDPLTDLPNRMLMMDRLEQAMLSSQRSGQFGALFFVDLDKFKQLNDVHGHHHGDLLLIEVGQRLKDSVREMDTVARLGGDEFVVIMSEIGMTQEEADRTMAQVQAKLKQKLAEPYQLEDLPYEAAASIGAAMFSGATASLDDLLAAADQAMYRDKQTSRP